MDAIRRPLRAAIAISGLALIMNALASATLQAQTISEHTWETPNSTPGAGQLFQCIYEEKWPCKASADHAPSVDQILAKYEEALGGAEALAKINTRTVAQRRFQDVGTPEDHYLMRITKKPSSENGRLLSIMTHSALDGTFLRWSNGCDEKGGYSWSGRKDPSGTPIDAKNSTDGICEQELYFYGYFPLDLKRLKSAFQRLEYKGVHKIFQPVASAIGEMAGGKGPDIIPAGQARDTYLLLGVPAKARDDYEWLYFDTKTGLLVRFASAGDNPNWPNSPLGNSASGKLAAAGNSARIVDLIQYRKVGDGTVEAFQFVNQGPETRVRGVTINVVENAPIDDRVLVRPKNTLRSDRGLGTN
jgi:hypothetical protein